MNNGVSIITIYSVYIWQGFALVPLVDFY